MIVIRRRLKKTEPMQVRFTPEMKEALRTEAEEKGTTIVSVIEEAIVRYFEEKPTPTVTESLKMLEKRLAVVEKRSSSRRRNNQ